MKGSDAGKTLFKVAAILILIYCFLLSISLMQGAFRLFGEGFAERLFALASNKFIGLFIGVLTTSLVQSSSFTTSVTVGLVGSGILEVGLAVPIIMGANIGTAVTNTLVAYGHVTRRDELQRGMEAGHIHDIFNILAVIILFPLELAFGFLEKMATAATTIFGGMGGTTFSSPIKAIVKPASKFALKSITSTVHAPDAIQATIVLGLALVILFFSLLLLVRVLKSLVLARVETFFGTYIFRNALLSLFVGLAITTLVQSSSVTTSLIVPMTAAGILTLEQIFPYTLGANVGTTVTAILASLATVSAENMGGVTIAFTHLSFNLAGIAILYPLRMIPIGFAREFGRRTAANRLFPLQYVILVFFYIPGVCIYLSRYGLTVIGFCLLAGFPVLWILFSVLLRYLQKRSASSN
jgi:sodium-dependent phosphate cotransporter